MRYRNVLIAVAFVLVAAAPGQAQSEPRNGTGPRFFASYEIMEMAANRFQYFAGDVGVRLSPRSQLRLVVMEVNLTESHLSDDFWARIVEGNGVKGYMRGYELSYDRFLGRGFYVMANAGYIRMSFEQVDTGTSYRNATLSLGSGIGYRIRNLFGIKGLFINPSIPIRYFFNPVDRTPLGTGTVQEIRVAPSVWTFIGFEF